MATATKTKTKKKTAAAVRNEPEQVVQEHEDVALAGVDDDEESFFQDIDALQNFGIVSLIEFVRKEIFVVGG